MCKKLFMRTSRVLWLVAFAIGWMVTGYGGIAIGQVAGVDDPSDMADSSGDIKRVEAWVDDGNLNLTMTVYGVFAPSVEDTPAGMTNRYYYHWLLDTDNDPATGFSNSEYEGDATNLQTPIGADLVVQFGWRDGNTNGVNAYDPLTEDSLVEDYEYTIDGDTIHAVIPLADLGLTPDDTIALSAFQEGASNGWQVDWVESVVLPLRVVEPVAPGTDGLVAFYALENDVLDSSGNGNDGTVVGASTFVEGPADYGMALEFDGESYVDCGNDASLDVPGPISIALWIRPGADDPEGQGTETAPLAKALGTASPSWSWQVRYGWNSPQPYMAFTFNTSPRAWVYVGKNLEQNEWAHIACSHDGATLKCYLNGAETDSTPMGAITSSPAPVLIGSDGWRSDWIGAIDEVAIYSRDLSKGEIRYLAGERAPYTYDGDALDEAWDHDNGSDEWDGTGPGEGNPGGAAPLIEDGVTFLRIQDTGDPRDYGMGDPGSNRKVYLTHEIGIGLDGARFEFCARVATSAPLDDAHPDGGAGIEPWPADGIGYHIRDGGKGMFGISDGVGIISFSLAKAGEPDFEDLTTDVLVMNNLVGAEPSGDVDTEDAAAAVATNMLAIDNATQWNTFVIDIVAGGAGTHVVSVSANGGPAESFDVTLGSDLEADGPFIAIGSSGTGGITAFDVDYISVSLSPAVDSSLVIYYSFDEVGDVVADQSGKGHDGVVVGDVTAEANGMVNGAANFANAGYLDLDGPSMPAEDIPTSAMTLAAWINMANTGGDHEIFSARASDGSWLIHPEPKSSGDIRWLLRSYGGTTIFQIRAGTVTWDQWLHFAGTYDKESGKAALYINGELIEELDVENPADIAGDWDQGARVGLTIDDGRPFTGLMDEFRMYTRALSQDEVLAIMQGP